MVTDPPYIHLTVTDTGTAAVASVHIHLDAYHSELIEHPVKCAQRTYEPAERPVAENARKPDDQHYHEFSREIYPQHSKVRLIARIGQKRH